MSIATTPNRTELEPLLQPGRIGSMTLRNRIVQSPIFTQYATTWGEASHKLIEYHRARARGGVGLIILENTSIDWEVGRTVGNPVRLDHARQHRDRRGADLGLGRGGQPVRRSSTRPGTR